MPEQSPNTTATHTPSEHAACLPAWIDDALTAALAQAGSTETLTIQLVQHVRTHEHTPTDNTYRDLMHWSTEAGAPHTAERLGVLHQRALAIAGGRRRAGAYFTPSAVVEHVLDLALEPVLDRAVDPRNVRVLDPAAGAGAFLTAAAHRIARRINPNDPHDAMPAVIEHCIAGTDIDPGAAEVCRLALELIQPGEAVTPPHVRVADALTCAHEHVDVIVGNPPFLGQLTRLTTLDRSTAAALRARTDGAVAGYADPAAAFLLLASTLLRPGGRAALLMPQSFLAARDVAAVRTAILEHADIAALWVAGEPVFDDAGVYVCAIVLERTERAHTNTNRRVRVVRGLHFTPTGERAHPTDGASWSALAADGPTLDIVSLRTAGTLEDLADITADFRDQYYGLQDRVVECDHAANAAERIGPRLITAGLIDPAACMWGKRPARIHKQPWRVPRADRRALETDPKLASWLRARLVPKALIATQTRTLEVCADPAGDMLPCVPVITAAPRDPADLWRLAAALASPVCTLLAWQRTAGTALSATAIKPTAALVRTMPTPGVRTAWDDAAHAFARAQHAGDPDTRRAALLESARASCAAYDLDPDTSRAVFDWWHARLQGTRT